MVKAISFLLPFDKMYSILSSRVVFSLWSMILQLLLTIVLLYIVVLNMSRYRVSLVYTMIAICVSILFSALLLQLSPHLEIIANLATICIMTLFLAWNTKEIMHSVIYSILSMAIVFLSSTLAMYIAWIILGNPTDRAATFSYYFICGLMYSIAFIISKLGGKLTRFIITQRSNYFTRKQKYYVLLGLLIIFAMSST